MPADEEVEVQSSKLNTEHSKQPDRRLQQESLLKMMRGIYGMMTISI